MQVLIKYINNGLAAFEERNGDAGVISLLSGAPIEVGDILELSDSLATNLRTGKQTRIVVEDRGMYFDDAVALIERYS